MAPGQPDERPLNDSHEGTTEDIARLLSGAREAWGAGGGNLALARMSARYEALLVLARGKVRGGASPGTSSRFDGARTLSGPTWGALGPQVALPPSRTPRTTDPV